MHDLVLKALRHWGLEHAEYSLVAARENHVLKVMDGEQTYALRLHRPGLRTSGELFSELSWMAALENAGISTPKPVPTTAGAYVCEIDGRQVSMLTWLTGVPLGSTGTPFVHRDRTGVFRKLGQTMAEMHLIADRWQQPAGFTRIAWDQNALLGPDPAWGRFWENPNLTPDERGVLLEFRQMADRTLEELETGLDFGLIHADLVRENIMVDGQDLHLIDFDDCGFGFRLFDVATALIKNMSEPDYPDLKGALLQGYLTRRTLDLSVLDLFLGLRAATYVGWIVPRQHEDGARARNQRMIAQAVEIAGNLLSSRGHVRDHV